MNRQSDFSTVLVEDAPAFKTQRQTQVRTALAEMTREAAETGEYDESYEDYQEALVSGTATFSPCHGGLQWRSSASDGSARFLTAWLIPLIAPQY
jgi:hypothetical protein